MVGDLSLTSSQSEENLAINQWRTALLHEFAAVTIAGSGTRKA